MKKTFKKLINTTFALLLLCNLCLSNCQTTIPSYSENVVPFAIVESEELK